MVATGHSRLHARLRCACASTLNGPSITAATLLALAATTILALTALAPPAGAFVRTASGHWLWENPLPQGNTLNDVCFPSATAGWAVGDNGTVLSTTDGGISWSTTDCGANDLEAVCFADAQHGWIGGDGGTLMFTADGGATWTAQDVGSMDVSDIAVAGTGAWNSVSVVAVGASGKIYRTTDGGATWVARASGTNNYLAAVAFGSAEVGWAVGNPDGLAPYTATILKTTNGGATWTPAAGGLTAIHPSSVTAIDSEHAWIGALKFDTDDPRIYYTTNGSDWSETKIGVSSTTVSDLAFVSNTVGYATVRGNDSWKDNGQVWTTTDGGITWSTGLSGPPYPLYQTSEFGLNAMCLRGSTPPYSAWIVGESGAVVSGSDMATWTRRTSGSGYDLNDVSMSSATHGWAVGYGHTILRTTDGVTWTRQSAAGGQRLNTVVALSDNEAFVCGTQLGISHCITHTADGGATWQLQTTPSDIGEVRDLDMVSPTTGWGAAWVSPDTGKIIHTSNGSTWTEQASLAATNLQGVAAADTDNAWAVGLNGVIIHTSNGSTLGTWNAQTLPAGYETASLHDVDFANAQVGCAVGGNVILTTSNGGATWTGQDVPGSGTLWCVRFVSPTEVWACGQGGLVLRSTDGGATWSSTGEDVGYNQTLTGIAPLSTGGVWVAGHNGAILVRDAAAPVVTDDLPDSFDWTQPQAVTLTASDVLSPVAGLYYSIDGGAAGGGAGASCVVPAPPDGVHTIAYWATDDLGNSGASSPATCTVRFDGKRPTPKVLAAALVKRGKKATLRYRVNDALPGCARATVTITIKTLKGKVIKRLPVLRNRPENAAQKYSFVCTLKRGTYKFWVSATDVAGNKCLKPAAGRLTVK